MLPVTSISDAANKLRTLLFSNIEDIDDIKQIRIGHPKDTFDSMKEDLNYLNLFVYHVKYDGYPSDGLNNDPFYIRIYCLITAVGSSKNSSPISAGEKDLRLIGEVMRILHEQPVLSIDNGDANELALLEVIPHSMDLDSLNHIWSTQGETAYRLSVAYEMSLAPIPLSQAKQSSPIVGEPLWKINGYASSSSSSSGSSSTFSSYKPVVEYLELNTDQEDWLPHICYVQTVDPTTKALEYVFKIPVASLNTELEVLIAGKENDTVKFVWQIWRRKKDNTIEAWKEDIADTAIPKDKVLANNPPSSDPFYPNRVDPENIDIRTIYKAKLPDDIRLTDTKTWQAVLYAVREWEHEEPIGSGTTIKTILRSNSVLFYGDGA